MPPRWQQHCVYATSARWRKRSPRERFCWPGALPAARMLNEEALALFREVGDKERREPLHARWVRRSKDTERISR